MAILDELLIKYPRFFYKEPDGNNYKHESVEAQKYVDFNTQKLLVKYSHNLDQPLQLWRNQALSSLYEMCFSVNLEDIKSVKLFRDGNAYTTESPVLLFDSGELEEGINSYEGSIWDVTPVNYLTENQSRLDNFGNGSEFFTYIAGVATGYTLTKSADTTNIPDDTVNASLKAEVTILGTGGTGIYAGTNVVPIPDMSKTYYGIALLKTNENSSWTMNIRLRWTDSNYQYVNESDSPILPVQGDGWTLLICQGTPPANATYMQLVGDLYGTPNIGDTLWFAKGMISDTLTSLWIPGGAGEIIPSTKYYLEVEDYHENILQKGFPENDTPQEDIYDHNPALDIMGLKYGVPRRTYKTDLTELEYPYTYPPYYIYETECDYYYQKRMQQHLIDYQTLPFPAAELKKFFQVDAVIENRAKYIVKMNQDVMVDDNDPNNDGKYMASENWNSATYNVGVNMDEVPANIITSDESVQSVLDRTFPLSKKGFFMATRTFPGPSDPSIACAVGLIDILNFKANIPFAERIGFNDSIAMSAVMPFNTDIAGFMDLLNFGLNFPFDSAGFTDLVNFNMRFPFDSVGFNDSVAMSAVMPFNSDIAGFTDSVTILLAINLFTENGAQILPKNPIYPFSYLEDENGKMIFGTIGGYMENEDGEQIFSG